MSQLSNEILFWGGELSKLAGAVVLNAVVDNRQIFAEDPQFGLQLLLPDKTKHTIWFLSDEEGNGSGRFQILPEIEKDGELKNLKLIQGN